MAETNDFWQARKDFLTHLNYTKGYPRTVRCLASG